MTATKQPVDTLFRPVQLGGLALANRVVMAPMTRGQSPGHVPNDKNVEYYRRRAAGGTGLIITEGTSVGHAAASGYPDVPAIFGEEALAGWKRVVDAVHAAGGKIMPQLWHVGSIRQPGMPPDPSVGGIGPSSVVHPFYGEDREKVAPAAMTEADIADVIAAFARAAGDAKAVGFDGVELHGAHGYLIDQFFWGVTNQREDGYGGDVIARTRFAAELIAAVRAAVGPSYPIVFRFSQWKMGDYAYKMAESPKVLEEWLASLVDAGVDIFHCSTRRFNDPEFPDSNLNLAGWTKKLTGKATISVGSVGLKGDFLRSFGGGSTEKAGIDALITRMEHDEFELIAIGRALLSDPEWANKMKSGKEG
ncbi:MAG TPA: NADH:flavin oxidoreductase, partial [Nannocystis exedens]|nr:NADH:flavin oxidoreductase [Nannocystis exedens]